MLSVNRRSFSNGVRASSIFFGSRRTQRRCPPRLSDNCNVKRLSIHSSSSRVKRLRCPPAHSDTCLDYASSHCPLGQTTFLTRCRDEIDCKSFVGDAFIASNSEKFNKGTIQWNFVCACCALLVEKYTDFGTRSQLGEQLLLQATLWN